MSFSPVPEAAPDAVPDRVDVCIVGAGPVGGALACRLAAGGVRVAVIDQARLPPMEHPDFDGRAYAIAASSRRLLEAAGIWQRLPRPSCPIEGIRVSDGKLGGPASPLFLHFDHRDAGEPFGWMTEARSLRVALNECLHGSGLIRVLAPDTATVVRGPDGVRITTGSGARLAARLVIAAEGRQSPLREAAGIPVTRLAYRQTGIVSAVAHERPHDNLALEHFLPGGPFAQLPMTGGEAGANLSAPNLSAIVWTERDPLAMRLAGLGEADFTREVQRRLGSHLGQVRAVGRRWTYALGALHAHRYVAERLALVGDAAHGIHPIAGQGLNLGFRDVMALSELVIEAVAAGRDPGDAALLARYQARRRPDNLAMLAATDLLDRLFSTDNPVLRLARDAGIGAVHRMPRLKRAFMARAMGSPLASAPTQTKRTALSGSEVP